MRKFLVYPALAGVLCFAPAAFAEDAAPEATPDITITGSAGVFSQYRFRGISQSDNKPVVQAAITVSHKSGFYISTWGSSASAGNSAVNIGGTEIDVYGGFTHGLGKSGVTFDGGLYGYIYPGASAGNYYELYGSLTKAVGPVTVKGGVNWAPDQGALDVYPSHSNLYGYGELSITPAKLSFLTLHTHLGHTNGGFNWTKSYLDYSAGVSVKWKRFTLDASVVGTNVSREDALYAAGGTYAPGTYAYELKRAAKTVGVVSLIASF